MKTHLLFALLLLTVGCGGGPLSKSTKSVAREAAEPQTQADWIARENATKTKCGEANDSWVASGSNGYESYSATCIDGLLVYTDTTKETQEWQAKEQSHKDNLASALVSRCLTAAEFREVTGYGYNLYTTTMVPYREEDVQSRFNAALQTQKILRMKCPN